jgi:hypothetical protein
LQSPTSAKSSEQTDDDNIDEGRHDDGVLKGVNQWLGSYQNHQTALQATSQHHAVGLHQVREKQSAELGAVAWESQYQNVHNIHKAARFMQLAGSDDFFGAEKNSLQKDMHHTNNKQADSATMQTAHAAAQRLLQRAAQHETPDSHAAKRKLVHETDLLRMKLHSEAARRMNEDLRAEGGGSFGWLWRS